MTERQEETLDFIREYQRAQGVPPSTREIARHFGVNQATVTGHLHALGRKGHLDKLADGKWGFKGATTQSHLFATPVYGTIPAGLPAMQEQQPDDTLQIDPALFGLRKVKPGQFWLLRVSGDSMSGANILDGDLVALIRREPKPGEIIAALVDETTTTLKRLVRERGRTLLRAANPRYPDLTPSQIECQGVVVGVIRQSVA